MAEKYGRMNGFSALGGQERTVARSATISHLPHSHHSRWQGNDGCGDLCGDEGLLAARGGVAAASVLRLTRMPPRMGWLEPWLARRTCTGSARIMLLVAIPLADAQLLLVYPHLLQMLENFARHAVGQVD